METDFKKKVFDEDLFQFSLELLNLTEKLDTPSAPEPARKVVTDAFAINNSLAELYTYIRTLNRLNLTYFPSFFENVHVLRLHPPYLFEEYLMTLRHLAEQTAFTAWDDFFKAFHALSSQPEKVIREFQMTVRHLTIPSYKFSSWEAFFKSVITISTQTEILIPFMTCVRHTLNYFKKPATFESMMKTLTGLSSLSVFEAYSYGQLESKKWLLEEALRTRGPAWGTVFILAGWVGSLAQLIFDSETIKIEKIRCFDIDDGSCKISEKINNLQVLDQWKFKAVHMDISQMKYPTHYFVKRHDGSLCELYDEPNLVINTSCEHIKNLNEWWSKIPPGTPIILQNNNAFNIPDHINCVNSIEEFKAQLPLTKIDFAGELVLTDYTRYMLIGEK